MKPRRRRAAAALVFCGLLAPGSAGPVAVSPAAAQADPDAVTASAERELDEQATRVAAQLRCTVCRNQSVQESSSRLAREMQQVIRERLAAGDSPEEVKAYFVSRYGDWILLQPRTEGIGLLVYLLPAAALVGGAVLLGMLLRRWSAPRAPADGTEPAGRGESGPSGEGSGGDTGAKSLPLGDDLSEADARWIDRTLRERAR